MEKSKDFLKMLFFLVELYYNNCSHFIPKEGENRWGIRKKEIKKQLIERLTKLLKQKLEIIRKELNSL